MYEVVFVAVVVVFVCLFFNVHTIGLLLDKEKSNVLMLPCKYLMLYIQTWMGWCSLQWCHWSCYQSWILLLYTEMCVSLILCIPPLSDTTLENIHLGQNNCERGLPKADHGSWEDTVSIYEALCSVSTPTSEHLPSHLSDPQAYAQLQLFCSMGALLMCCKQIPALEDAVECPTLHAPQ